MIPRTAATHWRGMRVIARGINRICVLDPDAEGHCLKYELPPSRSARRYWRRRLRYAAGSKISRLSLNGIELVAWERLYARLGNLLCTHATPCVGLVQTPAGTALRCRLVTDVNGNPAPTIATMLATTAAVAPAPADLCEALDSFEAWLFLHQIPLPDLNAGNLAVTTDNGRLHLVCVDLKSTLSGRELIPLSRWSWPLMRRKMKRRCARLRERIRTTG